MKKVIYLTLVIAFSGLSCKSQNKQNSKASVRFNIENDSLLKYPLSIRFATHTEKSEMLIEKVEDRKVDTLLECKTAYVIRFQSEGILSENIKYYNKSCNDTTITLQLRPIEIITHQRDSNGVIID